MRAVLVLTVVLTAWLAPMPARAAPYADMVMDARSGEILHATNADSRLHPASLTKMMTLYVAFEAIRLGEISLDTPVTISAKAAAEPPSKLGLRAGQRIQLRYLIRAAAVKSANDAATAIGEAISGSEAAFARRMNRTATAMGMTRTTFKNAHGLTQSGHLSTARDMTILGRHVFYDYPQYYNIFSRRAADAGIAQVANTNRRFLDAYPGADGIKTGFTNAAGFNLVASAERGEKRIIATVFGGTSTAQRNARITELMNLGFQRAPTRTAVNRPRLPRYEGIPQEPAEAVIALNEDPTLRAAGKIIRISGAVTRSPRPVRRGAVQQAAPGVDADAVLAAIQTDVAAAFAVAEVAPAAADPTVAAAAEQVAQAAAAAIAEALGTAPAAPASDLPEAVATAERTAELPFAFADAGTLAAVAADGAAASPDGSPQSEAEAEPVVAAAAPALTPRPRPAGLAPAASQPEVALAAADPLSAPDDDASMLVAEAEALSPTTEGDDLRLAALAPLPRVSPLIEAPSETEIPADRPDSTDQLFALAEREIALATRADAASENPRRDDDAAGIVDPAAAGFGRPQSQRLVLASAALVGPPIAEPVIRPEPEAPEIVTRLSTSGGRHSGISIGRFTTRGAAERALIQMSLSDMASLDGALRRVVQRGGGYEANFMGMSADQAALACRRLAARGADCTTIGG